MTTPDTGGLQENPVNSRGVSLREVIEDTNKWAARFQEANARRRHLLESPEIPNRALLERELDDSRDAHLAGVQACMSWPAKSSDPVLLPMWDACDRAQSAFVDSLVPLIAIVFRARDILDVVLYTQFGDCAGPYVGSLVQERCDDFRALGVDPGECRAWWSQSRARAIAEESALWSRGRGAASPVASKLVSGFVELLEVADRTKRRALLASVGMTDLADELHLHGGAVVGGLRDGLLGWIARLEAEAPPMLPEPPF